MSDAVLPTPPHQAEQVRAAADALKAAIDRHLAAVQHRSGEADPAVFAAFDELATAADVYDELLYDVYDEVTPFEVPDHGAGADEEEIEEPEAISVLIRRDYLIVDRDDVLAAARQAYVDGAAAGTGADAEELAGDQITGIPEAVAALLDTFDPDEIHDRAEEIGLEPGDATLWVLGAQVTEPGEWLEEPFADADLDRLLYRLDIVGSEGEEVEFEDELTDDDELG